MYSRLLCVAAAKTKLKMWTRLRGAMQKYARARCSTFASVQVLAVFRQSYTSVIRSMRAKFVLLWVVSLHVCTQALETLRKKV